MAKQSATKRKVAAAFHEVMHNTPKIVKTTARKKGAAQAHKQEIAIALSKARAAGAHIPKKGGNTTLDADSMKYQALAGRKDNLAEKVRFKAGHTTSDPYRMFCGRA